MPIRIKRYSPNDTANGGGDVKKNSAWSAGAVRNRMAASSTARTPATFGLQNNEINDAIGNMRPTVMKNPANASVRISLDRVSNPKGVNRKPSMIPMHSNNAKILSLLLNDEIENFKATFNPLWMSRRSSFH